MFTDWAFNATTVFLYYNDYDRLDEDYKQLMRTDACMGFSFAPARYSDDVVLYADRQKQSYEGMQEMLQILRSKLTKRCLLQPTM